MERLRETGRDFGGICTRLLLEFLEWRVGSRGLEEVLADAGEERPATVLRDDATWSSYDQLRSLLEAASRRLGSPEELIHVGELPSIGAGSRPEITALLQTYGSPLEMALAVGQGVLGPGLDMGFEAVGPAELLMHVGLGEGLEPFPELCKFIAGMVPLSVRIFGLQPQKVAEIRCRHRGDDECLLRMAWDESEDLALQLEFTRFQLDVATSRMASFQRTVEEIVSSDDLDVVLRRIVEAATRATTATAFLLEVDVMPSVMRRYADGVEDDRLEEISARATAGEHGYLVVNVTSAQRDYGRIVVLDESGSLEFERPALQGYARLAATALDAALALEEARRQAETSRALLELSTSLAQLTSADELAARLARALPSVIDCDCAVVLLVNDGLAKVAGHHGLDATSTARIEGFEIDISGHDFPGVVVHTTSDASPMVATMLAATGLVALAAAPILVERGLVGLLVAGVRDRAARIVDDPSISVRFSGLAGQAAVALQNGLLLDRIRHQSLHDPLTELPNRALIIERAKQILARARRQRRPAAVLYIDLDGFKDINDTLGHASGDELLQMVARRLESTVRESDTVGRLGGDEFVVLVDDAELDAVGTVAQRLLEVLREPSTLSEGDRPVVVEASIGIAISDRSSANELMRQADIALYAAKAAGKDCYRFYEPEMRGSDRVDAETLDVNA